MELNNLKPAKGSTHHDKRIGRGAGSGHGGTATRGHKGAQSRSGYSRKLGFEGGQMPLQRRLPKFGFTNLKRVEFKAINLSTIEELAEKLSINAEGLKASVEQYNADAAAGAENAQIAAVPKRALDAEGPYYGVRVEAANHMTKGGVVCNENAQVLNADDTVVPGLYAAGEVTWQGGGYSESVCFGKVAGAQAAMAE